MSEKYVGYDPITVRFYISTYMNRIEFFPSRIHRKQREGIHKTEHHSTAKRKGVQRGCHMAGPEDTTLGEVSQAQKHRHRRIPLTGSPQESRSEAESRWVSGLGEGRAGSYYLMAKEFWF